MRLLQVIMVAVLTAGAATAFSWSRQATQDEENAIRATMTSLERLQREIRVRSAMGQDQLNGRGWPLTIDPEWFGSNPPRNHLVAGVRPWVEVASPAEYDLEHPPMRLAIGEETASFWYNPGNGAVRARIGVQVSDRKALALYNRVNRSAVADLVRPLQSP
ncbi:MAG: hypothetical protein AAFX05_03320 [Planctomycetota bacterium]